MVAAAYSGYWANPEQITFEHEKVVESSIEHIDAIDKALAEREACDDK